jgi:hypothetical protein
LIVGLLTNAGTISSYRHMMMFFAGLGVLSLTDNIIIKLYDKYKLKGKLSKNSRNLKRSMVNPDLVKSENISIA